MKVTDNFRQYAHLYDSFYQNKAYAKEVEYLIAEFDYYKIVKSGRLLDLGSGTGNHGNILTDAGYEVLGIEKSEQMISATEGTRKFKCIHGDITKTKLDFKFEVATSLFHVVSYLTNNIDVQNLFNLTYKHLRDNGIFYFDYWFSPSVLSQQPKSKMVTKEDVDFKIIRFTTPTNIYLRNLVEIKFDFIVLNKTTKMYEEFSETHIMRHFGLTEIEMFASEAGFKVLKHEEICTKNKPSEHTWAIGTWLRKE